jgi:hypothetical protein
VSEIEITLSIPQHGPMSNITKVYFFYRASHDWLMANALFPGLIFEHYPRRGADEPHFRKSRRALTIQNDDL